MNISLGARGSASCDEFHSSLDTWEGKDLQQRAALHISLKIRGRVAYSPPKKIKNKKPIYIIKSWYVEKLFIRNMVSAEPTFQHAKDFSSCVNDIAEMLEVEQNTKDTTM